MAPPKTICRPRSKGGAMIIRILGEGQFDLADFLVVQIYDVHFGHDRHLLARRTTT